MTHLCYIHYARALPAGSPLYTWSAKHAKSRVRSQPVQRLKCTTPYSFEFLNDSFGRRPKALVSLLWFLFASLSLFGLSFHRSLLSSLVSFFTSLFSSAVFFFTVLSRWSLPAGFSLFTGLSPDWLLFSCLSSPVSSRQPPFILFSFTGLSSLVYLLTCLSPRRFLSSSACFRWFLS